MAGSFAQGDYSNHSALGGRLKALTERHKAIASVRAIGKSAGQRDIWLLTLSKGDAAQKPAILLVAGVDGAHLAGTEIALQLAEAVLQAPADSVAALLEANTLYIIPSLNPDAQEQYFAKPRYVRHGNATATDDDRDGRVGEDPLEDLNRDGLITQVRVEDLTGTYVADEKDPRIMVLADPAKGQRGQYRLISEGIDNDKDGEYNEDGSHGVNIDQNFTYDYPVFERGAGVYAASEPETRAFLDFLYERTNILAVVTLGPANNLSEAPKFDRAKASKRIITGWLEADVKVAEMVSKLYNDKTALKDAPSMPMGRGNLSQTAYYHAGRFSFSTPGWWPTLKKEAAAPADSLQQEAPAGKPSMKRGQKEESSPTATFLKWADQEGINAFVNWTPITHPDFPNQKAEVGGIHPFAMLNPPVAYLQEAATGHQKFLVGLAAAFPRVELSTPRVEALGGDVYRLTVQVVNKGLLPTHADIGNKVRFVPKMKTSLSIGRNQNILSGKKMNLRDSLAPGEAAEYSWLISGSGPVTLEAGCPTAGMRTLNVSLK